MGDRCTLSISIRRADERLMLACQSAAQGETLEDYFDDVVDVPTDPMIHLTIWEANYGMTDECEEWAKTVNFTGGHGSGGNYGPMQFVAWDGELIEVCSDDQGMVMCPVDPATVEPYPDAVAKIKRYFAACKAFDATLPDPEVNDEEVLS